MRGEGLPKGSFSEYQKLALLSRYGVLLSFFGLLATFTVSALWLPSCNRSPSTIIWLLHIVPLLFFVRGIVKKNVRTHVWVSFICLGYFLVSVNAVFACPDIITGIEIGLISVLFTTSTMYIRWRSREQKLQENNAPE
ncbi:MAG: putative membrane protein [Oceanicoccus sp.]|jgi:uncharacterized membrane protein